ncbi:hypothetical protein [Terasakiella pusilla]|uniref:hypothetical protein n=1 Tax=Terasakiella pusilla TaxID=64973 RepID=UPI003AA96F60
MDYNKLPNDQLDIEIRNRRRTAELKGEKARHDRLKHIILTSPEPYSTSTREKVVQALIEDDMPPLLSSSKPTTKVKAIPFSESLAAFKADEASLRSKLTIPFTPQGIVKCLTELDSDLEAQIIAYEPYVRVQRFLLNQRLTQLGMAPRWRGLIHESFLPGTQFGKDMKFDNFLYDLEWLSERRNFDWLPKGQRKKPNVKNRRWKELFENRFDLKLAESIISHSDSLAKKMRAFNLDEQLLWECWALRTKDFKKVTARHKRREEKARKAIEKNAELNALADVENRLIQWSALTITAWSSTAAARQYRVMTGKEISQQSMSEILHKLMDIPGVKKYV